MASIITTSRFSIHRFLKRGTHRFWLTCLLCLCAWRGPVPIVHSHSLDWQTLATSDVRLAAHALRDHPHGAEHGDSGWHIHFVLPCEGNGHLPANDDSGPSTLVWQTTMLDDSGDLQEFDLASSPGIAIPTGDEGSLDCASGAHTRSIFLWPDPTPKRLSPHAWLCVARC